MSLCILVHLQKAFICLTSFIPQKCKSIVYFCLGPTWAEKTQFNLFILKICQSSVSNSTSILPTTPSSTSSKGPARGLDPGEHPQPQRRGAHHLGVLSILPPQPQAQSRAPQGRPLIETKKLASQQTKRDLKSVNQEHGHCC